MGACAPWSAHAAGTNLLPDTRTGRDVQLSVLVVDVVHKEFTVMSRLPSNRSGQSFIEFALIIILFAIVLLSILLILGDDLRTFINDLFQTWFPA